MPIYFWSKDKAILFTKAARYVPVAIAAGVTAVGTFIGWLIGKKRQEGESGKRKH